MLPEEQLQKLYLAGFELEAFERFPKAIGVVRDNCIAFLVPGPDGLQILGNIGWRMGESLGPLVERGGRKVFVHKDQMIEATSERISILERFRADLKAILQGKWPDRKSTRLNSSHTVISYAVFCLKKKKKKTNKYLLTKKNKKYKNTILK